MKYKNLFIVVFVVLLSGLILEMINSYGFYGIDDANIYVSYMQNIANGNGFRYSYFPEVVEGYSSPLWTLIGSLYSALDVDVRILLFICSFLFTIWGLYLLLILGINERIINDTFLSKFALLLAITMSPGFLDYSLFSLMETSLVFVLLALLFNTLGTEEYSLKNWIVLGTLTVLISLTRPEFFVVVPVFLVGQWLYDRQNNKLKWGMIIFVISTLIITLIRAYIFGYPLPNTFYAKVSFGILDNLQMGAVYMLRFLVVKPWVFILPFFYIANTKFRFSKTSVSVFYFVGYAGFVILVGGDHFKLQRLFQPLIPFLVLVLFNFLNMLRIRFGSLLAMVIVLATSSYNIVDRLVFNYNPIKHEWDLALKGIEEAEKLNQFFQFNYPSVGVYAAGGIGSAYNGECIDLLGLNNPPMAHAERVKDPNRLKNHASFDYKTFLAQRPDIVAWKFLENSQEELEFSVEPGMLNEKTFKEYYCLVILQKEGKRLQAMVSKKYLTQLVNDGKISWKTLEF